MKLHILNIYLYFTLSLLNSFSVYAMSCDDHLKVFDQKLGSEFVALRDQYLSIGDSQHPLAPDRQTQSDLEMNALISKLIPESSFRETALGGHRTFDWTKLLLESWLVNPVNNADSLYERQVSFKQLEKLSAELRAQIKDELSIVNQYTPRFRSNFSTLESTFSAPAILPGFLLSTFVSLMIINSRTGTSSTSQIFYNCLMTYTMTMYIGALGGGFSSMTAREQLIQWMSYSLQSLQKILTILPEGSFGRLGEIRKAIISYLEKFPKDIFPNYKDVKRYHSEKPNERKLRSSLQVASGISYYMNRKPLKVLKEHLTDYATLLPFLVELDLYTRVADQLSPAWSIPRVDFEAETQFIEITKGHHPVIALSRPEKSIANPVVLSKGSEHNSGILLTGPNFRGKSVFLKMMGTLTLMAQAGLPVPAESMQLTPHKVITNFRAIDSTEDAESLFYAQAKRIAHIQKSMVSSEKALYLFDEILTGTSPEEREVLERQVLSDLARNKAIFVFASHQRSLAQLAGKFPGVLLNKHMSDSDESGRKYRIEEGPSTLRNALQVMKDAGVDEEFLNAAATELSGLHPTLEFRR